MKRAIIFVLLLLMVLSLVACGGTSTPTPTPEPTPKPSPEPVYKIGETISTDNTELTIHDAKFAYYLSSVQSVGKPSEKYITPYEDESKRGTDTFYTASTGHSFVWLSFDLKNKDRGSSLSFGHAYDWNWAINYEGQEYKLSGFDLNNANGSGGLSMDHASVNDSGFHHSTILLYAGQKASIRAFGVVNVDPSSLTDGFDLIIKLPNSSGDYETFVYAVD